MSLNLGFPLVELKWFAETKFESFRGGTRRLKTPFCQNISLEETPLNQYSKLMRFHDGVDPMELGGKLWPGRRIMIKSLYTDQQVRFGIWSN